MTTAHSAFSPGQVVINGHKTYRVLSRDPDWVDDEVYILRNVNTGRLVSLPRPILAPVRTREDIIREWAVIAHDFFFEGTCDTVDNINARFYAVIEAAIEEVCDA